MSTRGWEHATPQDTRHRRPLAGQAVVKRSKYGAVKTMVDGIVFHSAKEARRYGELKLLEKADRIDTLECQPEYELSVPCAGVWIKLGVYRADFRYWRTNRFGAAEHVVEDVKGFKTQLYRWKKKHVEAQYNIEIREV